MLAASDASMACCCRSAAASSAALARARCSISVSDTVARAGEMPQLPLMYSATSTWRAWGLQGSQPALHGTSQPALHVPTVGCIRPRASGRVRSTSSLKLSRRVPLSAGGGGGGGSGAVVPARPAPRLARCLRSFFLRLSHGCRLTCHGAARHQGVLDARIGVRASWGRARAPGATKGGTASGRLGFDQHV